jgi:hypothetical protein
MGIETYGVRAGGKTACAIALGMMRGSVSAPRKDTYCYTRQGSSAAPRKAR